MEREVIEAAPSRYYVSTIAATAGAVVTGIVGGITARVLRSIAIAAAVAVVTVVAVARIIIIAIVAIIIVIMIMPMRTPTQPIYAIKKRPRINPRNILQLIK
jgi:hypothetical protein